MDPQKQQTALSYHRLIVSHEFVRFCAEFSDPASPPVPWQENP
jgi:hypothetical protein